MMDHISDSTVRRMSSYLRVLDELEHEGAALVSSSGLAEKSGVYQYDVALALTAMGRRDEALTALERAFAERDPTMVNLKHDPRFDPLRSDPRYGRLLAQMRFP